MKNLPIGIQSFAKLRQRDCLYVDKTKDILQLITTGGVYFLSRPRRFGKSLLVSTIEEVFKGNKPLFEGLYIYDNWDWTQQYPVIRLDLAGFDHRTAENLQKDIERVITNIAQLYGIILTRNAAGGFSELIQKLHETTGKQVVVLVDEYDKPITEHLLNPDEVTANRKILHSFFQILKAADEHLRFVFFTGVSKFSGVSIFSALNNLNDITLDVKYASICGLTQQELENYFADYIDDVAQQVDMSRKDLLTEIRVNYDGYSWDGKTPVYNPFSTLMFFDKKRFANYWFRTGTPTFLIDLLKKRNQIASIFSPIQTEEDAFDSYDPNRISEIPLLFQTGYLTIKQAKMTLGRAQFTLGVPNSEVNDSLLRYLLSAYSEYPADLVSDLRNNMQRQIQSCDVSAFEQSLRSMLANIPYNLHIPSEAYYHSLLLLWIKMLGFDIQGEVLTNIGRIDAVWYQPELTVVAEIKYHAKTKLDTLLNEAMAQINDRKYYEKYLDHKVILMAVAFSGREVGCRIKELSEP
ncbi:ATPase AAA [Bacteroidia bacterium]|nr:ATPase AAA [Bacteroidia bacterium]